jgi:hypothetical protein
MNIMSYWWNELSEGWKIVIVSSIVIPAFLKTIYFLFKANRDFFKILADFQEKLPPKQKKAIENNDTFPPFSHIDTTNMKMNLTTQEIDLFQKKLETFNYSRIVFNRKKIQAYSNNIQRLIITSAWPKFGIAIIQELLEDERHQNSKPYLFGSRLGKIIGF